MLTWETRRWQHGLTLIELMVTVALVALLLVLAMPSLGSWMADARVRSSADALQNALRLAQGEAIKRSRTSVLMLTTAKPDIDATPATNGSRWVVKMVARSTDTSAEAQALFVRGGAEPSSQNVTVNGPALLCFNAFGQPITLTATATGLGTICSNATMPIVYSLSATGASHDMQVQVGLGGQVRMCNPAKSLSNAAPDGC